VLVFRLEHFVGKDQVIIRTCKKMVLSAIWNEWRHVVVEDDLLAAMVGRAACHMGCHNPLRVLRQCYGNCSILLTRSYPPKASS
jgi:hypothetical protein